MYNVYDTLLLLVRLCNVADLIVFVLYACLKLCMCIYTIAKVSIYVVYMQVYVALTTVIGGGGGSRIEQKLHHALYRPYTSSFGYSNSCIEGVCSARKLDDKLVEELYMRCQCQILSVRFHLHLLLQNLVLPPETLLLLVQLL